MSELERAREIKSAKLALIQKEMQLDVVGGSPGEVETDTCKFKTKTKALGSRYDLRWVTCPFWDLESSSEMKKRGSVRLK